MNEEDIENIIGQMKIHNQQLQAIMMQLQSISLQNREIEKALEELDKSGDEVYKSIGPILVKSKKDDIKKELEENKVDNELRIKTLEKQEKKIKEKMTENQKKVQDMIPRGQAG